jgi:tetratricopeptide (TPR) repeat protein
MAETTTQSRGPGSADRMLNSFHLNMDSSSLDSEAWLALYQGKLTGPILDELIADLRSASPESPWITRDEIVNHWDASKAHDWEQSHGGYPSIQLALAQKYTQLGQWDDAVRCMQRYIRVSPDVTGYQSLANVYKAQGHEEQWLATLKDYLAKTEAIGLEHAQVQVEIANYYMAHHQFKESLPFADAAAETGAAWGLQCAASAHTGAGQFERAEELLIEEVQHYNKSPFFVVAWCLKTRHGSRREAIGAFRSYIASKTGNLSAEDTIQLGLVDELEGKTAAAIAVFNKRFTTTPGPVSLFHVMLFADESGDTAALNAAVRQASNLQQGGPVLLSVLKELAKAYQGPKSTLDLNAVDAIIQKSSNENERIECDAVIARYLLKHDRKSDAIRYVTACYSGRHVQIADDLLIYETTTDLGLDAMALADQSAK